MRFFTAATFFLAATAAPVDQSETSASNQVEKRLDPITISIITGVTSAAAGWATTEGLNTLKGLIKDTSSWDKVSPIPASRAVGDELYSNVATGARAVHPGRCGPDGYQLQGRPVLQGRRVLQHGIHGQRSRPEE